MIDYVALRKKVFIELGEDIKTDILPLFKVLCHVHERFVEARFQYASSLMFNNNLAFLVEPNEYPIVSQYNNKEQDYIKSAFCVCLNRQVADLTKKNTMKK